MNRNGHKMKKKEQGAQNGLYFKALFSSLWPLTALYSIIFSIYTFIHLCTALSLWEGAILGSSILLKDPLACGIRKTWNEPHTFWLEDDHSIPWATAAQNTWRIQCVLLFLVLTTYGGSLAYIHLHSLYISSILMKTLALTLSHAGWRSHGSNHQQSN